MKKSIPVMMALSVLILSACFLPITKPSAETTTTTTPAVETPAVDTPAVETPAAETPAVETPAVETPAVETPAAETPAVETPAVETPAVEPPAVADKLTTDTPVKFALQTEAQDAVFYIGSGWTGGMGGYPVFDAPGSGVKMYNDLPIYFEDAKAEEVLKTGGIKSCYVGSPTIKISANITLDEKSGVNGSIPPDENGNQPTEKYYQATLNKLYEVLILGEECKE